MRLKKLMVLVLVVILLGFLPIYAMLVPSEKLPASFWDGKITLEYWWEYEGNQVLWFVINDAGYAASALEVEQLWTWAAQHIKTGDMDRGVYIVVPRWQHDEYLWLHFIGEVNMQNLAVFKEPSATEEAAMARLNEYTLGASGDNIIQMQEQVYMQISYDMYVYKIATPPPWWVVNLPSLRMSESIENTDLPFDKHDLCLRALDWCYWFAMTAEQPWANSLER